MSDPRLFVEHIAFAAWAAADHQAAADRSTLRAQIQQLVTEMRADGFFVVGYGYLFTADRVHEWADQLEALLGDRRAPKDP